MRAFGHLSKSEICFHVFRSLAIWTFENSLNLIFGQVIKGMRWMPRHTEAMKDVVSCDKLRRGANNLRSADFRMG